MKLSILALSPTWHSVSLALGLLALSPSTKRMIRMITICATKLMRKFIQIYDHLCYMKENFLSMSAGIWIINQYPNF